MWEKVQNGKRFAEPQKGGRRREGALSTAAGQKSVPIVHDNVLFDSIQKQFALSTSNGGLGRAHELIDAPKLGNLPASAELVDLLLGSHGPLARGSRNELSGGILVGRHDAVVAINHRGRIHAKVLNEHGCNWLRVD